MFSLPSTSTHRPVAKLLNTLVLACLLPGMVAVTIFVLLGYQDEREHLSLGNIQAARALGDAVDTHLLRAQALAQSLLDAGEVSPDAQEVFSRHAVRAPPLPARAATWPCSRPRPGI